MGGRGGGLFKIYDEPLTPNEEACFQCMMNRNHQIKGMFKIHVEPNRQRRARVEDVMRVHGGLGGGGGRHPT